MRLSKTINSFGALSLINFARKHAERVAQHVSPEIAADGEPANERQVDALFPPIAEARVAEGEPQAA
jgi:hypothetical protein